MKIFSQLYKMRLWYWNKANLPAGPPAYISRTHWVLSQLIWRLCPSCCSPLCQRPASLSHVTICPLLYLSGKCFQRFSCSSPGEPERRERSSVTTVGSQAKITGCSEVKCPIFEGSGLPPSPLGSEVVVKSAFILRSAVRDSAVVLPLELRL